MIQGSGGREFIKLDVLKKFLAKEGRIETEDALHIIKAATEIMREESTLVNVQPPVTSLFISFNTQPNHFPCFFGFFISIFNSLW